MPADFEKYKEVLRESREFVLYLHIRLIKENIPSLLLALSINFIYTNHQIRNLGKHSYIMKVYNDNEKMLFEEFKKIDEKIIDHLVEVIKKGRF